MTGAMETHSDLMLRIEAKRGVNENESIKLIWWDPTIEEPPIVREHGKEVDLREIYIYLPPKLRENRPTWNTLLKDLFSLP